MMAFTLVEVLFKFAVVWSVKIGQLLGQKQVG